MGEKIEKSPVRCIGCGHSVRAEDVVEVEYYSSLFDHSLRVDSYGPSCAPPFRRVLVSSYPMSPSLHPPKYYAVKQDDWGKVYYEEMKKEESNGKDTDNRKE